MEKMKWFYEFLQQFLLEYGFEILSIGGLLAVLAALIIVTILLLNNLGAYFKEPARGTTTFINAGKTLKAVWPNIGGYKMSEDVDLEGRHWLVHLENRGESKASKKEWLESFFHDSLWATVWFQKWLWKKFGIRFMGWFYPQVNVHSFDIRSRLRLLEGANLTSADMPLKDRVVDSFEPDGKTKSSTIVDSLLFLVPRPVYVHGVFLAGDNSRINILVQPIYRQIIPVLPVYYLKGDFFTQLDGAVESAVVDFCATHRVGPDNDEPLTFNAWLGLAKAGGESSLGSHLRKLNATQSYRDKLNEDGKEKLAEYVDDIMQNTLDEEVPGGAQTKKIAPSGIIQRFGFAIVSVRLIGWEPHKDTKDLSTAILAKETEFHTAEGVRETSYGERDAILAVASGESKRFETLMEALVKKGVEPNVAAHVVETQLRMENLAKTHLTTYVEGGASTPVLVSNSGSPSTSSK